MDCIEAILSRRSIRSFVDQKVEEEKINIILSCALASPSPANKQPWEFIVIKNVQCRSMIQKEAEQAKAYLAERSGWKWLPGFKLNFITEAPVLIAVVGDPSKNGAEQFLNVPSEGYINACSAAIQNICLASHSLGLGTLWLSLYEKEAVRKILGIDAQKDPVGIVCLGYPAGNPPTPPRKGISEKVRYIE